jgi:hypothetical protein
MITLIVVYHSGVLITNEIDTYEFVGMKNETFLLNEFLTSANVIHLVCGRLGWIDESCKVWFEGRIYIGSSNDPRMKTMIELVARMVAQNDVDNESSRSSTLTEAVDQQHIECGIVLTQSS